MRQYQGEEIWFFKEKIFVPEKLRHRVIVWYHHFLCHPGESRLADTLQQTMFWPGLTSACKYYTSRGYTPSKCLILGKQGTYGADDRHALE